jgi:hypothetical protein
LKDGEVLKMGKYAYLTCKTDDESIRIDKEHYELLSQFSWLKYDTGKGKVTMYANLTEEQKKLLDIEDTKITQLSLGNLIYYREPDGLIGREAVLNGYKKRITYKDGNPYHHEYSNLEIGIGHTKEVTTDAIPLPEVQTAQTDNKEIDTDKTDPFIERINELEEENRQMMAHIDTNKVKIAENYRHIKNLKLYQPKEAYNKKNEEVNK